MKRIGRVLLGAAAGLLCLAGLGVTAQAAEGGRDVPHYDIREKGGTWDGTNYQLPDGTIVTDAFFCDGTYTYYLMMDGTPMMDRLSYHPDGEHVIYLDAEGHEVFSNFTHVAQSIAGDPVDDLCFFDVYGHMYVDVLTYDQAGENLYYANPYGVMERNGWFEFSSKYNGGYGYANANGTLMAGEYTYDWNGNLVYMEANGHMRVEETPAPTPTPDPTPAPSESEGYTERVEGGAGAGSWTIKEYDGTGNLIKETIYEVDGSISYGYEYEYDSSGNCTKKTYCNAYGRTGNWYGYEYDSAGNRIKETYYAGRLISITENEYDSVGNRTKSKMNNYDVYGNIDHWTESEYDSAGNLIKNTLHSRSGIEENKYDSSGNLIKRTFYHSDGSIRYWYEQEYDSAGNKIKYTQYNANGNKDSEDEYDSDGKFTKHTSYNYDAGGNIRKKTETEYNISGSKIKETRYDAVDGSISSWHESEYDSAGKKIKETYYYFDGSWYEYEYDSAGNRIKETQYDAVDGNIIKYWYEYEYDSAGNKIKETRYNADGSINYIYILQS